MVVGEVELVIGRLIKNLEGIWGLFASPLCGRGFCGASVEGKYSGSNGGLVGKIPSGIKKFGGRGRENRDNFI